MRIPPPLRLSRWCRFGFHGQMPIVQWGSSYKDGYSNMWELRCFDCGARFLQERDGWGEYVTRPWKPEDELRPWRLRMGDDWRIIYANEDPWEFDTWKKAQRVDPDPAKRELTAFEERLRTATREVAA